MSGDGVNQRRALTPELRRLQIRTNQNYTTSGRTRSASRTHTPVRREQSSSGVTIVPVQRLLSGNEFDSPLLTPTQSAEDFGNLSFVEFNRDQPENFMEPGQVDQVFEELNQNPPANLGDQGPVDQALGENNPENLGLENLGQGHLEQEEIINQQERPIRMAFNYRHVDGLIPVFDGKSEDLDRFIRGVNLAHTLTDEEHHPTLLEVVLVKLSGRAQALTKEGMVYDDWEHLRGVLKHRFQTPRPVKAVRKVLESLFQKPNQSVRDFALEVEDLLAEFITASSVGLEAAQRNALAADREAQALEIFVDGLHDKLRDWAKARDFDTLKDAVDFAISEEPNVKPKMKMENSGTPPSGMSQNARNETPARNQQGFRNNYRGGARRGQFQNPSGGRGCHACGELGHFRQNCPRRARGEGSNEPRRVVKCEYCQIPGHSMEQCFSKERDDRNRAMNPRGSGYQPTNQPPLPKNGASSSASPANIRTLQTATVQVHREPANWNDIQEISESPDCQSN